MPKLTKASEIVTLASTASDRKIGAKYASRTLPWTFNRMSMGTKAKNQGARALNIAKGIVAQEVLQRELETRGIDVELHRKSHRSNDLFDFRIRRDGAVMLLDVKSIAYYNDYAEVGRPAFSKQLIIDNRDYPGPDWRKFFPMLMAHTQVHQAKDAYVFIISESVDLRKTVVEGRSDFLIAAFPYGAGVPFYSSKRLCLAREDVKKGFNIKLEYQPIGLFGKENIHAEVLYEWAGKTEQEQIVLKAGTQSKSIGPISALNCISLDQSSYEKMSGTIIAWCTTNTFVDSVLNSRMDNINVPPSEALQYTREDFCNLCLPDDYKLHCIGWIAKQEFLEACKQYPAWVWPIDSKDRFLNSCWSQISERDQKMLDRLGVGDRIDRKPTRIKFGLMKTSGRGPGACCYVFPNIFGTGVRETNLFVLPQDLQTMASLKV
jgi:hypothetical protein